MDLVDESPMPELESWKYVCFFTQEAKKDSFRYQYLFITELTDIFHDRGSDGVTCSPTKPCPSKKQRYTNTCMDDLFPSRENDFRLRLPSGKRNDTVCTL